MKDEWNSQPFEKIVQMIHSITKIDVRLNDQAGRPIFQIIDHSVPAVLNQSEDGMAALIHEVLRQNESNHFCHYVDPYGLEYIAAGIWENRSLCGSILIGPVISSVSVIELVKETISNNRLPVGTRKMLEQFYQSLPILSDVEFNHIGELLVHLCLHHHIDSRLIALETPKSTQGANPQKVLLEENKKIIELRYEHQNKLMDAITKGDKEEVIYEVNHLMTELVAFSDRVPGSPIRSSKNIGFVLNTMCRIAAEKSGVHPVYLHNMSERFAIMIEKTTTLPNLTKLFLSIVNEYCDLVITFSTGHYSPIVKKAMDFILLNLGSPLPLEQIAVHIHVNPSHLSRKFKAETGITITDFINQKRVHEAKLYLQRGNISVTDVAFMVGFNDVNYFSKVFKKITSETPSQYAKRRH